MINRQRIVARHRIVVARPAYNAGKRTARDALAYGGNQSRPAALCAMITGKTLEMFRLEMFQLDMSQLARPELHRSDARLALEDRR